MTSSWPAACLTAGNESLLLAAGLCGRQLFYLLRRLVLPVEHQPASGRTPGAGGAAVSVWPASGADAAMSARLLARFARRRVDHAGVAGAGSGAGASPIIDDRGRANAAPGGADFPLSPSARLAHAAASGRGADRRCAVAVSAVDRQTRHSHGPAADPHRRADAGPDLPGYLALSHQHRLATARPGACLPAGELARAAPHLVSATVRGQPVVTAGPAGGTLPFYAVLPGAADYRPGLALRLAGGADRHPDERHRPDCQPDVARSSRRFTPLAAGTKPDRAAAGCGDSAPA
ncbi:hypothetical protein D3C71_829590 [compost metagenome]